MAATIVAALCASCSLAGLADGSPLDAGIDAGGHGSGGTGATSASSTGPGGSGAAGAGPSNEIWAKAYGDEDDTQEGSAVAIDRTCPNGGCPVVVGSFSGAVDFGGGKLMTTDAFGDADVFVAKLAPDAGHVWSKQFGNDKEQRARTVAVDKSGEILVGGWFKGAVDFGNGLLTATPASKYDAFVAKLYGPDGMSIWSKRFGGVAGVDDDLQSADSIAVDSAGDVFVAGTFGGKIEFGGPAHMAVDGQDIYLAKLGPDGAYLWSKSWDGSTTGNAPTIAVDKDDNVLFTGNFSQQLDFGCLPALAGGSDDDIFVAKLAGADGGCIWNAQFGDANPTQFGRAIVAAPNGDAIVVCELSGGVNFGGKPLFGSSRDVAVARLAAADGKHMWSVRPGDPNNQMASAVAIDAVTGGVYIAGSFLESLGFAPGRPLHSHGQEDIYLAKLDPLDGQLLWSEGFGDIGSDFGRGVAVDDQGKVLLTGKFRGTVDFGMTKIASAMGQGDVFVAKFDASAPK